MADPSWVVEALRAARSKPKPSGASIVAELVARGVVVFEIAGKGLALPQSLLAAQDRESLHRWMRGVDVAEPCAGCGGEIWAFEASGRRVCLRCDPSPPLVRMARLVAVWLVARSDEADQA